MACNHNVCCDMCCGCHHMIHPYFLPVHETCRLPQLQVPRPPPRRQQNRRQQNQSQKRSAARALLARSSPMQARVRVDRRRNSLLYASIFAPLRPPLSPRPAPHVFTWQTLALNAAQHSTSSKSASHPCVRPRTGQAKAALCLRTSAACKPGCLCAKYWLAP